VSAKKVADLDECPPHILFPSHQRMDRLPSVLVKGSGKLQATLLIASFGDAHTIKLPLVQLALPASLSDSKTILSPREKHEIQQGFQRRIERRHTFNVPAADQMPPKIVSLVAAAVTLVLPSAVMMILVRRVYLLTVNFCPFFSYLRTLSLYFLFADVLHSAITFDSITFCCDCSIFTLTLLSRGSCPTLLDWRRIYTIQDDAMAIGFGNSQHLCRQDCTERDEKSATRQAGIELLSLDR
jgi:hypothetical protein